MVQAGEDGGQASLWAVEGEEGLVSVGRVDKVCHWKDGGAINADREVRGSRFGRKVRSSV